MEKYKKKNLQPIVEKSKTFADVLRTLGLRTSGNNRTTLKKYIAIHNIDTSHFESKKETYERINGDKGVYFKRPTKDILVKNSTYNNTSNLKNRLYKEGLKKRECELCGQDEEWKGKKMSLILDHKNGMNDDNRIENLRIVCANCNATLPTHCGKNKHKKNRIEKFIKSQTNKRVVNRPSYTQLTNEIELLGYSGTGRKYNVSDNAIRKWIIFYEKHELMPCSESN